MKKIKISSWNILSLRVICLFVTAMLVSFSPEYLHGFFGDVKYTEKWHHDIVDGVWDWGFRHFLYFWMCVALFVIQAVRLIMWVSKNDTKFTVEEIE